MGRERRITGTVGTIPENHALAGTVTTSSVDSKVLIYSGSDDIEPIITKARVSFTESTFWLYVAGKTPFVSRIIGIYKNADMNYTINLETAIAGCSSKACAYVRAGVAYSYTVDGGAPATINGVSVLDGESNNYKPFEVYSDRPKLQPVSYVDATGTDVFISEEL